MKYQNHRLDLPDLSAEIRLAWSLGQHRAHERWPELGINTETGNRLQLGALLIRAEGRLFRPAKSDDLADKTFWASVMPTSWDGHHPYDLMAITPKVCWLRLGVEEWLGTPGESPYFTNPSEWFHAGGKGSCFIGRAAA